MLLLPVERVQLPGELVDLALALLPVLPPGQDGFPGENAKFLALEVWRGQSHKFNRPIGLVNSRASTH